MHDTSTSVAPPHAAPAPADTAGFDDAGLQAHLDQGSDAWLDTLAFGVIGIDGAGIVRRYNAYESRLAGLSPERVLGKALFTAVAPCMNNALVAERLDGALARGEPLDVQLAYVLTLRMRPVKVTLRLLATPGSPHRYVVVRRPS